MCEQDTTPDGRFEVTYLRVAGRTEPTPRGFGPLPADHPAVGCLCPGCERPIVAGDVVGLAPVGPGDDAEARERARAGRPYNARAIVVHWACLTGEEPQIADAETGGR